ncbi:hypothetical protein B0J18DRAFT_485594 [Chaetomium sp. MPI-SDFR-AT-0129]|nr:hypothetical protein B0J18DRAFT_485594 [Chaetomium sp. MPI-SDFR-AT-0129]
MTNCYLISFAHLTIMNYSSKAEMHTQGSQDKNTPVSKEKERSSNDVNLERHTGEVSVGTAYDPDAEELDRLPSSGEAIPEPKHPEIYELLDQLRSQLQTGITTVVDMITELGYRIHDNKHYTKDSQRKDSYADFERDRYSKHNGSRDSFTDSEYSRHRGGGYRTEDEESSDWYSEDEGKSVRTTAKRKFRGRYPVALRLASKKHYQRD